MAKTDILTIEGVEIQTQLIAADYNAKLANTIKEVKRNGTALPVTGQSVNVTVPTKVSDLSNDAGFLTEHQDISSKADKATTLAGYGITDAYTKTQTDSAINTALSSALKYKGSYDSFAALTVAVTNPSAGDVYNIKNAGGTDEHDVNISAGDNVAYSGTGWDVLSGTVDLSGYATTAAMTAALGNKVDKVSGKGLSTNDFTAALKTKLDGIFAAATKTEASATNGYIKINGAETRVYNDSDVLKSSILASTADVAAAVTAILNA